MAGNRIVAKVVPLSERSYIVGYAEMCGYLGGISKDKLVRDYINYGLVPKLWKNDYRWKKSDVDKWLDDHDEWQNVEVRPGYKSRRKNKEI